MLEALGCDGFGIGSRVGQMFFHLYGLHRNPGDRWPQVLLLTFYGRFYGLENEFTEER
jgi:hypothetical protein